MLEELKTQVCQANIDLVRYGLVILTWGNASAFDREKKLAVIKPSGVDYDGLKPEQMVVVDLEGNVIEGTLRPSSDTLTHLEIYRHFQGIGGIVHTHSEWATSWAQSGRSIPPFGTTHADYFNGEVPCTRSLTKEEVEQDYERNTGKVIVEAFGELDASATPAVLVKGHAPFTWGEDVMEAVKHAVVLENIAKMAFRNIVLGNQQPIEKCLLEKHFRRKHGDDAYYGQ